MSRLSRTISTTSANVNIGAARFAGLGRVNPPTTQHQGAKEDTRAANNTINRQTGNIQTLNNLLKNFGQTIGLSNLSLNEQQRCSLLLGEGDNSIQLTLELAPDAALCLYTILDKQTQGITEQIKDFINNQPGSEDGTYLSINSAGTTVFLCLSSEIEKLNGLDFETLIRNFYSAANEWRRKYNKLSQPIPASSAILSRPAAKDRKLKMDSFLDKATGFLAIAYIIYRMGGILA